MSTASTSILIDDYLSKLNCKGLVNNNNSPSRPDCTVDELWKALMKLNSIHQECISKNDSMKSNKLKVKEVEKKVEIKNKTCKNKTCTTCDHEVILEAFSFIPLNAIDSYIELGIKDSNTIQEIEKIAELCFTTVVGTKMIKKSRKFGALLTVASKFRHRSSRLRRIISGIFNIETDMYLRRLNWDNLTAKEFKLMETTMKDWVDRTYKREPMTFEILELEEAMKILKLEKDCSDVDIIKRICLLRPTFGVPDFEIAGAIFTVCLNRNDDTLFKPIIDDIVLMESVVYFTTEMTLPKIRDSSREALTKFFPIQPCFNYSIESVQTSMEILGLKNNRVTHEQFRKIMESRDDRTRTWNECLEAAMMRIALIPENMDFLDEFASKCLFCSLNDYIYNLRVTEEVQNFLFAKVDLGFGFDEVSFRGQLKKIGKELSISKAVVNQLQKKSTTSALCSENALLQVELNQLKKDLESKELDRVLILDQLDLSQKEEAELVLKLAKEKEENFLLESKIRNLGISSIPKEDLNSTDIGESSLDLDSSSGVKNSNMIIEYIWVTYKANFVQPVQETVSIENKIYSEIGVN